MFETLYTCTRGAVIRVAKTKALIGSVVTAQLNCAFVFAYIEIWFSHGAHLVWVFCPSDA